MTLSARSFGNVVRYCRQSTDGWDSELWCIDRLVHAEVNADERYSWLPGTDARVTGPCDGSCAEARDDLRKLFAELPGTFQTRSGRIVPDPVHADEGFERLLAGPGPLVGLRFNDGYCKRDSQWTYFCLDRKTHVEFSTSFDWADDPEQGRSHRVMTCPCDGSCREAVRPRRKAIGRILRDLDRAGR